MDAKAKMTGGEAIIHCLRFQRRPEPYQRCAVPQMGQQKSFTAANERGSVLSTEHSLQRHSARLHNVHEDDEFVTAIPSLARQCLKLLPAVGNLIDRRYHLGQPLAKDPSPTAELLAAPALDALP